MPHDARAVANHFLSLAEERGQQLSVMALLKIMYFAHAWHLAKYRQPLIAQQFEAWKHGPVNRVVYEQLNKLGSTAITEKLLKLDVNTVKFVPASTNFEPDVEKFLVNIFDYYSRFHPYELSDLTHEKNTPWDIIWTKADKNAVAGMLIPDALILDWFEKTGGRLYLSGEQGGNV